MAPIKYSAVRRFGVILPSVNTVLEPELAGLGLRDVTFHVARVRSERGSDEAVLRRMAADAPLAALLLSDVRPERIIYACTSGSLVGGPGYDQEIARAISARTSVPASTTATEVLRAFALLGVRSIGVGTPYLDWVTQAEARFFEAAGYNVVATASLGLIDGHDMAALLPVDVAKLARAVDGPAAEAIFLSCTDLPTLGTLARLERELGKPVVSSNLATVRGLVGERADLSRLGRLFSMPMSSL
jgi:maleate isomerase